MSALNQAYDMLSAKIEEYGNARHVDGVTGLNVDRESLEAAEALSGVRAAIEALIKVAHAQ